MKKSENSLDEDLIIDEDLDDSLIIDDKDDLVIDDDLDDSLIIDDKDDNLVIDDNGEDDLIINDENNDDELIIEDSDIAIPIGINNQMLYNDNEDSEELVIETGVDIDNILAENIDANVVSTSMSLDEMIEDLNMKRKNCSIADTLSFMKSNYKENVNDLKAILNTLDPTLNSEHSSGIDRVLHRVKRGGMDTLHAYIISDFTKYYFSQIAEGEEPDIEEFMSADYRTKLLSEQYSGVIKDKIPAIRNSKYFSLVDLLENEYAIRTVVKVLEDCKRTADTVQSTKEQEKSIAGAHTDVVCKTYAVDISKLNCENTVYVESVDYNDDENTYTCGCCGNKSELKNDFYTIGMLPDRLSIDQCGGAIKSYLRLDVINYNKCPECNHYNILTADEAKAIGKFFTDIDDSIKENYVMNSYRLSRYINPIRINLSYSRLESILPHLYHNTDELVIEDDESLDEAAISQVEQLDNSALIRDEAAFKRYKELLSYFRNNKNFVPDEKEDNPSPMIKNNEIPRQVDMEACGIYANTNLNKASELFFSVEGRTNINIVAKVISSLVGIEYDKYKKDAVNSLYSFISHSSMSSYFDVTFRDSLEAKVKSKNVLPTVLAWDNCEKKRDMIALLCGYVNIKVDTVINNETNEIIQEGLETFVKAIEQWFSTVEDSVKYVEETRTNLIHDLKYNFRLLAFTPIVGGIILDKKSMTLQEDSDLAQIVSAVSDLMIIYNCIENFTKYWQISLGTGFNPIKNLVDFTKTSKFDNAKAILDNLDLIKFETRTKREKVYAVLATCFSELHSIDYEDLSKLDSIAKYLNSSYGDEFELMVSLRDFDFLEKREGAEGYVYDTPTYKTLREGFSGLLEESNKFIAKYGSTGADRLFYYLEGQFEREELEEQYDKKYKEVNLYVQLERLPNETLKDYMFRLSNTDLNNCNSEDLIHFQPKIKDILVKYAVILNLCNTPTTFVWTYTNMDIQLFTAIAELIYMIIERPLLKQLDALKISESLANKLSSVNYIEMSSKDRKKIHARNMLLYSIYTEPGFNALGNLEDAMDKLQDGGFAESSEMDDANEEDRMQVILSDTSLFAEASGHLDKELLDEINEYYIN